MDDDQRAPGGGNSTLERSVWVGIVLGVVIATVVSVWILSIPKENEARFWAGGISLWLTIIVMIVVGIVGLIASLIRSTRRLGVGLVSLAVSVGVTLFAAGALTNGFGS